MDEERAQNTLVDEWLYEKVAKFEGKELKEWMDGFFNSLEKLKINR